MHAPLFLASGAGDLVEKGLASLLKDRGVPADRASTRAAQAAQRLGLGPIQSAMCSPNPWRCLKQLGSNASPAFQFVLQDELAQVIQARTASDPSVKRQRRRQKPAASEASVVAAPVPPQMDQVRILAGVFASEGQPLHQVELRAIDTNTQGVVLVDPEQAAPYLRLARPVSNRALALVILGEPDLAEAAVHVEPVRFRAEIIATSEPVLLQGVLAQIGDKWCERHVPNTTPVEVAASSVARIAVYRDSLPIAWDEFVASPLKCIVSMVPSLQPCDVMGCECHKYRGEAGPNDPPPILESWNRQYFGPNFKPCPPASATLFNLLVRVPAALEGPLQAVSGLASIYFEPRAEGLRMPSSQYAVIWMPRQEYKDVLLLMQTHDLICGLARIGDRYGVRCRKEHEEQLHSLLKPSVAWVDKDKLRKYESGPWPFGTQRANLVKALAAFGWRARPGQPIQGHKGGLWFVIEAESPPPQDSLHASFGEVLFWEIRHKGAPKTPAPPVVASRRALQALAPGSAVGRPLDPLAACDPWQDAVDRRQTKAGVPAVPAPSTVDTKALESSIVQRVRSQLPSSSADLEASILAKVDAKLQVQGTVLNGRMDGIESKVSFVASQVESQEQVMRSLFDVQMSRIEEPLGATKRRNIDRSPHE